MFQSLEVYEYQDRRMLSWIFTDSLEYTLDVIRADIERFDLPLEDNRSNYIGIKGSLDLDM